MRRLAVTVAHLVRAGVALLVLAGLLVGVPAGLWHWIGWPLPHHIPSGADLRAGLTRPLDVAVLVKALACVVWAGWGQLVACVAAETVALAQGRTAVRIPAARPAQTLAAVLLGAVLLPLTAAAGRAAITPTGRPSPPVTAVRADTHPASPATVASAPDATAAAPGGRRPVIAAASVLSTGVQAAGGGGGGVVPRVYRVVAGDSLWKIAGRELGDPTRWPQIYQANRGRPQADGRTLSDPDLIQPGWILALPPTSAGTPPPASTPPAVSPPPASGPGTTPAAPPPVAGVPGRQRADPPPSAPAPTPSRTPPADRPAPAEGDKSRSGHGWPVVFELPSGAFVGVSLAAAVSAALALARLHRRRRHLPAGAVRLPAGEPPAAVVRALRRAHLAATATSPTSPTGQDERRQPDRPPPEDGTAGEDSEKTATATHRAGPIGGGQPASGTSDRWRAEPTATSPPAFGGLAAEGLAVGAQAAGEVSLDLLATGGLGLVGAGAVRAARHLLVALLATGGPDRPDEQAQVVVCTGDLRLLLCGDLPRACAADGVLARRVEALIAATHRGWTSPARLTVTADGGEALRVVEAELVRRGRILADQQAEDLAGLRRVTVEEPLPPLVLLATVQPDTTTRLRVLLGLGGRLGVGAVLLGAWNGGLSCQVAADGTITTSTGPQPGDGTGDLVGVRLFGLDPPDTLDLLALLHTAAGLDEPADGAGDAPTGLPPAPQQPTGSPTPSHPGAAVPLDEPLLAGSPDPAGTGPPEDMPVPAGHSRPADPLVSLSVFGPVTVATGTGLVQAGLRSKARELAAFLAVHTDGAGTEAVVDQVWAGVDARAGTAQFRTVLSNLRRVLREATGVEAAMFVLHHDGRYRLDADLLDVDLWRFHDALARAARAASAGDVAGQREALEDAVRRYAGDLADGSGGEWVEPAREALRRQALDAHSRLADLYSPDQPEQALVVLDSAVGHDPYNEALHVKIMRLQRRLGRPEAVARTLAVLTERLAALDAEPSTATLTLAQRLQHPPTVPAPAGTVGQAHDADTTRP